MKSSDKTALFESASIPSAVAQLAIPTVASSLVMVIYSLADTFFVGLLNSSIQTAAVSLASPVLLAFNAVNNLFGVGTSSMMGRALGCKDYDVVKRSSAFGFWAALVSGLLFSVLYTTFSVPLLSVLGATSDNVAVTAAYLRWTVTCGAAPAILNVVLAYLVRSEGAAFHASIGTMGGCILNILLDPIFVLPIGLNMGAAGAGLATFISNCFACLYFFILLFVRRGNTYVCINPRMAAPRSSIVKGIFIVGIPASIQNLLNVTGMTILNNFASAYGSAAVAAFGICQKIYMVPMQIAWGLSQGVMPLISYNYGNGTYARIKKALIFTAEISLGFLIAAVVVLYAFSGTFVWLFIKDTEIITYGTRVLRGMCLALPFFCIDFLGVATFQSCGKGGYALVFAIMRKIVLEIPALFILNALFPLYGLAYAQPFAEFVLAIASVVTLVRMFQKLDASSTS